MPSLSFRSARAHSADSSPRHRRLRWPDISGVSDRTLLISIGLIALILRVTELILIPTSSYPDADWYVTLARQIAAGHGLTIPYIWNWVDVGAGIPLHPILPIPAGAHWLPGAAFLALPGVLAGGTDFLVHLPFVIVAAGLPMLGFLVGRRLFVRRRYALMTAFAVALPGVVTSTLDQPDNMGLFALLAGIALYSVGRLIEGAEPRWRWRVLAGVSLGLAAWSRPDAVLIALAIGLLVIWRSRIRIRDIAAIAGITGLIVAPWAIRQLAVFGSISPSSSTGRILWIRTYNELFMAGGPLTPDHLLAWPGLLASRLAGIVDVSFHASLYLGWVVAGPIVLIGVIRLARRSPLARVFLLAFLIHAVWSALVATAHVDSGNYLHGVTVYLLIAGAGLIEGGRWIANLLRRFWPGSRPIRYMMARATLPVLLVWVIICTITSSYVHQGVESAGSTAERAAVAVALRDLPANMVILSAEPGLVWTTSGHPGVPTPIDGPELVKAAIRSYHVGAWLVLDSDLKLSFAPSLIDPATRPSWIGTPQPIYATIPDLSGATHSELYATLLPILAMPPP